jgi:hypothetical protein
MSEIITLEEADSLLEEVVKRTQTDPEFRQLCLGDPKAATKQATGKELPENYILRFVENQGADLTVVLPDFIDAEAELSEADLDRIAGGKCPGSCAVSCPVSTCVCFPLPTVTGIGGV